MGVEVIRRMRPPLGDEGGLWGVSPQGVVGGHPLT